ncbi:uncharacterized protein LOC123565412 isoform X3 [Mercenaria mercenaria]|uniref:uncharacterized protein LOC123565412 isoform X3 n=1 Tax=Mercenaria mercenaria TaxID=6596 RepID=UPI00234E60C7|nr:uncharacterized protein LOC123565412 isoform X3 [Mercenaria mercenaria]
MSSGVTIASDVKEKYQMVKTGKKNPYIVFKLSDDLKSIVVDKIGEPGETFEDFRNHMLAAAECKQGRYAVYDLVPDEEEASKNKTGDLVFIVWYVFMFGQHQYKILKTSYFAHSKSSVWMLTTSFK